MSNYLQNFTMWAEKYFGAINMLKYFYEKSRNYLF